MDQALYPVPEGPVVGLALLDQCRQGGFPNQRKEYVADRSIGIVERRLGDAKQQSGLALDALQLADHLGSNALLGAHRDPMDDLDEQIHQSVGDLPAALTAVAGCGEAANGAGADRGPTPSPRACSNGPEAWARPAPKARRAD
jgi:hypothetical protein